MDGRLLKRLEEVTAAYGADPARWPADERTALEQAAAARPDMLREASEMDRVLALASIPKIAAGAKARLARATGAPRDVASGSNVIPLPSKPRDRRSFVWPWVAAALAASLACGIYLGTLDSTNTFFDPTNMVAASDDPVDLAGLGDLSDYLEGES